MVEYNSCPDHLREIDMNEWMRLFFIYQVGKRESRQVMNKGRFDLMMFDITTFDGSKIGLAIKEQWSKKERYTFCLYGSEDEWSRFASRFSAQFAGDNS